MNNQELINQVRQQIQIIKENVEKNFLSLSETALNQKPASDKWSIAECLEHLNYYSKYYNNAIKEGIQIAQQKNWKASNNFKSSWLGKMSIQSVHPNNQKKMKAQKFLNPSLSKVSPEVVQRFIIYQEEFLTLLQKSEEINLNKVKIRIEVMKLLKLSLGDIFLFMAAHHQRHYNQAINVLQLGATV